MNKKDYEKVLTLFKERTKKDCYKVVWKNETPDILDDKIGGPAYLPLNEEYPKDKNGKPLSLLLQVNLKNIDLDYFPKSGILEIFIDTYLDYPCSYVVKIFQEDLPYQTQLPEIEKVDFMVVDKPSKIDLEKTIDYMPLSHIGYDDILNEICFELFDKDFETINDENSCEFEFEISDMLDYYPITIGGYANFTQTDVRNKAKFKNKTICLFKLDSLADSSNFSIGDAGIIFALISPEDLQNKKVEDTLVDWECC
ncbi:MAG: DUF1963 domain-containing protein [Clostridia bacterium]|nr:DUF1963 domain-containing protein [Clostridia bacterium]